MLERNTKHIINIEGLNHEGQGVGRINNFVVFVPDSVPGETIEAVIIKPGKSFAVARRLKTLNQPDNTDRTDPFCSSYLKCGGCSMQHIAYEAQLKHKRVLVEEALSRIGGFSDDGICKDFAVSPVLAMSNPAEYRNKAQFPIVVGKDMKPEIGFYSPRTHKISDGDECGIHHPSCDAVRRIVRELIIEDNIKIYDEIKHEGLLRHLIVRVGVRTDEVMAILVCNGRKFPEASKDRLVTRLSASIKGFKSLWLNVNTQKSNIITGSSCIKLWGSDTINERIGPLTFRISPLSFFQVNTVQAEVLYEKVKEFAGVSKSDTVFDLYCGTGTIGLYLASQAKSIVGIETVAQAVADAKINADANGIDNATFLCGDAETEIARLFAGGLGADVVVVDPPRKGCEARLLSTINDMKPSQIIYVSCNPATLARDLALLCKAGQYKIAAVQPVDMFPWTGHVETVVLITRVEK